MENKSDTNIIMYTTEDGLVKIEATFDSDTVWFSIDQMAELFQRDKSRYSKQQSFLTFWCLNGAPIFYGDLHG